MRALRLALIVLYTAVLGTTAVVACLVVPGGALFTPLARVWAWLIVRTCGVRIVTRYHPSLDAARPCVYVSNHQSLFDIPALILSLPTDFRMVAKRELLWVPIFGWALWLAGFIFIDRADRARAIRSLERAAAQVARGRSIVIFAEGTRSPDGHLLPFKKGGFVLALKAGAPVVPVSVRGSRDVLPKGSLTIRAGRIEVIYGAPVDTLSFSHEQRDDLIDEVRRRIVASLGVSSPSPGD